MLALPQSDLFTAKYGRAIHSYIVGTKTKKNKKKRKKTIEPAAKKKTQHSTRGGGRGINTHKNISFWVVGFLACYPIQFCRGLGILYVVQQIGTLTP